MKRCSGSSEVKEVCEQIWVDGREAELIPGGGWLSRPGAENWQHGWMESHSNILLRAQKLLKVSPHGGSAKSQHLSTESQLHIVSAA